MHRGASVTFTSGFGQTISDEMRREFSTPGREFVGGFEYQDLQLSEARSIMLRLKRTHPDVAFVDGQPEGLATFLKRRREMEMQSVAIVSHSAIDTAISQKLVDRDHTRNVYFLRRKPPTAEFAKRFQQKYGRSPVLNADLGYSAGQMGVAALKTQDPLATLRKGMTVDGLAFIFDNNQVADGIAQEIFQVSDKGEAVRVEVAGAGR
jgi:ABC-type branched-subunit amino acid transport system substrate-binding protein